MFEALEGRLLMSVSLQDGVLVIRGTPKADRVLMAPAPGLNPEEGTALIAADSTFTLKFNKKVYEFKANDIRRVKVNLGDGDDFFGYECVPDTFWEKPIQEPFEPAPPVPPTPFTDLPVFLRGGRGRDRIVTGNGNDRVWGGTGDDRVSSGRGDDSLTGGAGADELHGRRGHDTLEGGSGADSIFGSAGDDTLFVTKQTKRREGGRGNNQLIMRK